MNTPKDTSSVVLVNDAEDALRQFQPDVAEAYLRITNALYPNRPRFMLLLAFALQAQERSDCPQKKHDAEVLELLRRTSEICPTDHVNAGCYARALMERGDYQAGWPEQRKWLAGFTYPPGPLSGGPKWDGKEPVAGRTVLLRCPDGFGDAFQYVRFASGLADQGARVIVAARPQALGVLQTTPGVTKVVDRGVIGLVPYDIWVEDVELASFVAPPIDAIPHATGYFKADPMRVSRWRSMLPPGRKVGLCWAGASENPFSGHRDIPSNAVGLLRPLMDVPNTTFVSLQVGPRSGEAAQLPSVLDVSEHLHDFIDTAALIEALDLTVSIETSVVHLAGALGCPVWVVLSHPCDSRWLRERADSPWYASARLFRQPTFGDWRGVIANVAESLRGATSTTPGPPGATPRWWRRQRPVP